MPAWCARRCAARDGSVCRGNAAHPAGEECRGRGFDWGVRPPAQIERLGDAMAHREQRRFCEEVRARFPERFRGTAVLEVGALNVNGTVRDLFADGRYVGLDCRPGPGVDVVALAHEYAAPDGAFDVVCALETFEHDPHAPATIRNMLRVLRPGGLFFMTCAGEGRPEHGTSRTGPVFGPAADFYRNVSLGEFCDWLDAAGCRLDELHVRRCRRPCDLYAWAVKADGG